jgi:hypothetical protein
MGTRFAIATLCMGLVAAGGGFSAQTPPAKVDHSKIVGAWQLEIDADGTYYYLSLNILENAGRLEGAVSEVSGMFKDVPLAEIVFDGEKLTFKFNSPTPPDGVSREVGAELKLVQGALDGMVRVPDLAVSAPAKGAREPQPKT